MPKIQKGARISEDDKKKIEKLKKKGATKSELSTIRMALLRGHTYRKALTMMKKKKASKPEPKKKTKSEPMMEEIVEEETSM